MSTPAESPLGGPVLHIADLSEIGGIPRVVRALAAGHRSLGLDVHVAVRCASPADAELLGAPFRAAGVSVHDVVAPARAYLQQRSGLTELCRRLRPAVVHTHGLRSDILGGAAARAAGVPVVSTLHGFTDRGWKSFLYQGLHRSALRQASAIVAVSRPLAVRLAELGIREGRLHTIHNAYLASGRLLPRAEARRLLDVTPDGPLAGWVGRLSQEKGADIAIDAVPLLRHTSLRLSLLGDGPDRAAVESQIRSRGLDERVRLHGAVPDADRLFAAFDVYVLSSRSEGTPIALFEAMDAGVPIVTTAVGGVPDVVTPAEAWLVPAEEPARLAEAIDAVLAQPAVAAERAAAARARLHDVYAPGPWLSRYQELYRSLAA